MRALLFISFLALVSCGTQSKFENHTIVIHDTINTKDSSGVHETKHEKETEKTGDTAVGVKGKSLEDSHTGDELQASTDSKGKKQAKHFSKYQDGIFIYLNVDTNGNFAYGAKTDSVTLVIRNLVERNHVLSDWRDSVSRATITTSHTEVEHDVVEQVRNKGFWGVMWPYLLVIGILAVLALVIKKFIL